MVIDIKDLEFRWHPSGETVLSLETLRANSGEHLFIEGRSGSGKSTLLSLLAGVTTAQAGSVRVLDRPLERLGSVERDHFRADHVGYIFQMFNLIPYLSVVDNVILPCRFSARRRDKALARVDGLETEAKRLLGHLDMDHPELLGRAVTTLNVGQHRRPDQQHVLAELPGYFRASEGCLERAALAGRFPPRIPRARHEP